MIFRPFRDYEALDLPGHGRAEAIEIVDAGRGARGEERVGDHRITIEYSVPEFLKVND